MYIHRRIALQLLHYTVIVAMLVHEKYNTPPHCITIMALCRVRGDVVHEKYNTPPHCITVIVFYRVRGDVGVGEV